LSFENITSDAASDSVGSFSKSAAVYQKFHKKEIKVLKQKT
jgi:hypothetical protein